jgi:nucleotide-binding universal stress UspA family protein
MLAVHTILYPTDFSETAQHAFGVACALARDCGAGVVVLHVLPRPLGEERMQARHHPEDYFGPAWRSLHLMHDPDEQVRVEHRLEEGDAASMILEVADEVQAGLIVMGTHGRSGLGRLLLGSVAEQVLRNALCPVLTVKQPVGAPVEKGPMPARTP